MAAVPAALVLSLSVISPMSLPVLHRDKKRVLMLISDTGGGHRASAMALEAMMRKQTNDKVDVTILDIWTEHGIWPDNQMPQSYRLVARYLPGLYRILYYASPYNEGAWFAYSRLACGKRFERAIQNCDPDLVVSLHPLCNHLPLHVTRKLRDGSVPFATVCTDLGSAHPAWFAGSKASGSKLVKGGVDACFVPSDAIRLVAKRRGVDPSKIFQFGLPVRETFWRASTGRSKPSASEFARLGLAADKRTVLVMGGGDGVGNFEPVVEATAAALAEEHPAAAQVVALCGKNAKLKARLEAKSAAGHWGGDVRVEARGFTGDMSEYMEAADALITKAGPGTIAEAAMRALPTMLSGHLPGQEWGNIAFVRGNGFGDFAKDPAQIARTVSSWLEKDNVQLQEMAAAARAAATPKATEQIAAGLLSLCGVGAR